MGHGRRATHAGAQIRKERQEAQEEIRGEPKLIQGLSELTLLEGSGSGGGVLKGLKQEAA